MIALVAHGGAPGHRAHLAKTRQDVGQVRFRLGDNQIRRKKGPLGHIFMGHTKLATSNAAGPQWGSSWAGLGREIQIAGAAIPLSSHRDGGQAPNPWGSPRTVDVNQVKGRCVMCTEKNVTGAPATEAPYESGHSIFGWENGNRRWAGRRSSRHRGIPAMLVLAGSLVGAEGARAESLQEWDRDRPRVCFARSASLG
jgi:hypothetical protein